MDITLSSDAEQYCNATLENKLRDLQRIGTQTEDIGRATDVAFLGCSNLRIVGPQTNPYMIAYVHACILAYNVWFNSYASEIRERERELANAA